MPTPVQIFFGVEILQALMTLLKSTATLQGITLKTVQAGDLELMRAPALDTNLLDAIFIEPVEVMGDIASDPFNVPLATTQAGEQYTYRMLYLRLVGSDETTEPARMTTFRRLMLLADGIAGNPQLTGLSLSSKCMVLRSWPVSIDPKPPERTYFQDLARQIDAAAMVISVQTQVLRYGGS